jgi:hypothetical protein
MASISLHILEKGFDDGWFSVELTENEKAYTASSILTVWEILDVIKERGSLGIDTMSIAESVGLHRNTVAIYLRWIVDKKLVTVEREKVPGAKHLYYRV